MLDSFDSTFATAAPATRNYLLAALLPGDYAKVASCLELVELTFGLAVHEPNAPIQYVYFPTTGSVSMMVVSPDGAVEVGSVGNEGFVGISVLLHADAAGSTSVLDCAVLHEKAHVDCFVPFP